MPSQTGWRYTTSHKVTLTSTWSTRSDVACQKLQHVRQVQCNSIPSISVGGDTVTTKADIANTLGAHITSVFSSNNYDPSFKLLKENREAFPQNSDSWVAELYNAVSLWQTSYSHSVIIQPQVLTVSTNKCSLTFQPRIRSSCCPCTTIHSQRTSFLLPQQ